MDDAGKTVDLCLRMPLQLAGLAGDVGLASLEALQKVMWAQQQLLKQILTVLYKISPLLAAAAYIWAWNRRRKAIAAMLALLRTGGPYGFAATAALGVGWYGGCYLDYGAKAGRCREKYTSCLNYPPLFPPQSASPFQLLSK
jgi:hypothetical protein